MSSQQGVLHPMIKVSRYLKPIFYVGVFFVLAIWFYSPASPVQTQEAQAFSCSTTGTGTKNWTDTTLWTSCNSSYPGSPGNGNTDTVAIANAALVITANSTVTIDSLSFTGGNTAASVTISGGVTLTVTNTVTLNASTGSVTKELAVATGNLSVGGLITVTGGSSAARIDRLSVTTGTITASAGITFSGTGAFFSSGSGATINLVGTWSTCTASQITVHAGTILNTTGSTTINCAPTAGFGIINVNSGTTTLGAVAITFAGATSITGALANTSGASTKTFNGAITVNSGGSVDLTTGTDPFVTFAAGITANSGAGSINWGNGVTTFSATQALAGSANMTFAGAATINTGFTLTNNNTGIVTFSSSITGGSAASNYAPGAGSYTQFGSLVMSTGILTPSTSAHTIEYNGGAQSPEVPTTNPYYHLILSGSGSKTIGSITTVTGNFTTSGTASATTVLTSIGGNFVVNGTSTPTLGAATLVVSGNLNVTGGTLTTGTSAFTVNGTTTVSSGTLTVTGATNNKTFVGLVTVSGGILNGTSTTAVLQGGLTQTSGTCAMTSTGLITFDTNNQQINGTCTIPNITVASGRTITNNGTVTVDTTLTLTGNWTQGGSSVLNFAGTTPFSGAGTFDASTNANTVNYTNGSQTVKAVTYSSLGLSGGGTKTMTSVTTVNANFSMSGTATTAVPVLTTIGGNLSVTGTASMTLGANLVVTGTTTIGDGSNASVFNQGATFNFTSGAVSVLAAASWTNTGTGGVTLSGNVSNAGTVTLDGSGAGCGSADAITLTSSNTSQRTWSGAGTFTLYDLTISYMAGSMTAQSSTDSGNNAWTFSSNCGVTASGTVYSDEGSTAITNGPTVRIKVNGAGDFTGVANGSGVYSINIGSIAAGNVITVYLDGATPDAVTVTRAADSVSNLTSLNLYQDRVIVRHEDAGPVTNANLGQYDADDDADILFTSNSNNLSVTADKTLLVMGSYTPGGTVTTTLYKQTTGTFTSGSNALDFGTFTQSGGTFNASSGNTTIGRFVVGNDTVMNISGGTFNHNSGTVIFDSLNECCDGGTITANVNSSITFNNVEVNITINFGVANIGELVLGAGDTAIVLGNLTHTDGILNGAWQLEGNLIVGSAADSGRENFYSTGSITLNGSGAQTYTHSGSGRTAKIIIDKASGSVASSGSTTLNVSGFTLTQGTFTAPTGVMIVGKVVTSGGNDTVFSITTGTFNNNGGTIKFDSNNICCDAGTHTIDVNSSLTLNNVEVSLDSGINFSTLALGAGDSLTTTGNLTHSHGILNGTWTVQGNVSVGAGADGGSAVLTFTGTNSQTWTDSGGDEPDGDITINKASGSFTLASNTQWNAASQDLIITSGTFSQGASYNLLTGAISVGASGIWSNTGTGDITLGGDVSNAGAITLDGGGASCGDTDDIVLTSTNTTQRTWSGAGTFTLRDLTVSYMAGSMTAISSTDGGNNAWTIQAGCGVGVTITGTIYSDEGSTAITSGPTVRVKVNGEGDYTAVANGAGFYEVSSITVASAGDVITVYIDDATPDAVNVTLASSTSADITSFHLYQNRVILRHENAGPITNTHLDEYDSGDDSDIGFTVTSGNLIAADGVKLIVWGGKTFTPGGTVTTDVSSSSSAADGDIAIQSTGTLSMGSNALSIGGDFSNSGTYAKSAGQTATFTATATGHSINLGTGNFDNLTFNGSGGGWSFSDASNTIDGDLTLTAGTLSGTTSLRVNGGEATGNGSINFTGGTFFLDGTGNFGGNSDWVFNNITFGDGTGTSTTTATGSGKTAIVDQFSLAANHTLDAGSKTIELRGSGVSAGGGDWWNESWANRRKITLNNSESAENLTNFPILVTLNSSSIDYANTQDSGQDIRFVDADGTTQLSHEIELWNESGASYVWVKVPQIDAGSTTDYVWMYYANAVASDGQNVTSVWGNNYSSVWHMNQDPATAGVNGILDSSADTNHGTDQGSMDAADQISGQVGYALDFDGVNDFIYTSDSYSNPNNLTLSAWVKTNTASGNKIIGFEGSQIDPGVAYDRLLYVDTNGKARMGSHDGNIDTVPSTTTVSNNSWHYITGTQNETTDLIEIFIDGVSEGTAGNEFAVDYTGYWKIGGYKVTGWPSGTDGYFPGQIDEVRLSSVSRSADWIEAEYNWISNPAGYNTFGSAEVSSSFTVNGTLNLNTSTVEYTTSTAVTILPLAYYNLTLNQSGATYETSENGLTINNSLTITAGTLDINLNDHDITVKNFINNGTVQASATASLVVTGDWTNNSTFTHNSGTVTFSPVGTSIITSGGAATNVFHNFTVSNGAGKTLQFEAGDETKFEGTLTLTGTSDGPLTVDSTTSTQWELWATGSIVANRLIIKNSGCYAGTNTVPSNDTNLSQGNNGTCWSVYVRGGGSGVGEGGGSGGSGAEGGGGGGSGGGSSESGSGGEGSSGGGSGGGGGGGASP
jgi:hypothetical protein